MAYEAADHTQDFAEEIEVEVRAHGFSCVTFGSTSLKKC
jgi:hypothetical protein